MKKMFLRNSRMEELKGGRKGKIYKSDGMVIRPAREWTPDIHKFLRFMRGIGADFVPEPMGVNEAGKEVVSFMPGKVYNYPLPENLTHDSMIISAARLLCNFHEFSARYVHNLTGNERWMLPVALPVEVMCHGDFAPYNVTVIEDKAAGIIDFDTLHPGSRMWDIAYAVYRWTDFSKAAKSAGGAGFGEWIRKATVFLNAYGISVADKKALAGIMASRLKSLTDFMVHEADNGNVDFKQNILEGHLRLYLDDIDFIEKHEAEISYALEFNIK